MKYKVSQEHVCEEDAPLNNNIEKQSGDLVEMPSEAVKHAMDDHVPGEINGDKLENKRYKDYLYNMHLLLNPSQREELENEVRSREELVVHQVEFADMEGQMQQLMEELKKSLKNAFFWKSIVVVFGVLASFMLVTSMN
ncbi:hypothetical protein Tco_0524073 [Tanacetum coccineum]